MIDNERLREIETLGRMAEPWKAELRELISEYRNASNFRQQIEDLKCCGNCTNSDTDCAKKADWKSCLNWQSDNITKKYREK